MSRLFDYLINWIWFDLKFLYLFFVSYICHWLIHTLIQHIKTKRRCNIAVNTHRMSKHIAYQFESSHFKSRQPELALGCMDLRSGIPVGSGRYILKWLGYHTSLKRFICRLLISQTESPVPNVAKNRTCQWTVSPDCIQISLWATSWNPLLWIALV